MIKLTFNNFLTPIEPEEDDFCSSSDGTYTGKAAHTCTCFCLFLGACSSPSPLCAQRASGAACGCVGGAPTAPAIPPATAAAPAAAAAPSAAPTRRWCGTSAARRTLTASSPSWVRRSREDTPARVNSSNSYFNGIKCMFVT